MDTGYEPALFLIQKFAHVPERATETGTKEVSLAEYYVLHGTIYQAPDLLALCASRVVRTSPRPACLPRARCVWPAHAAAYAHSRPLQQNCAAFLGEAVQELVAHMQYTPSEGRTWDFLPEVPRAETAAVPADDGVGAGGGADGGASDCGRSLRCTWPDIGVVSLEMAASPAGGGTKRAVQVDEGMGHRCLELLKEHVR